MCKSSSRSGTLWRSVYRIETTAPFLSDLVEK